MQTIPNRQYTKEFQAAAVNQVLDGGRSVTEVARSLEMSDKTLSNWVRRVRRGQPLSRSGQTPAVTDVQAELSRLRTENAQLKQDKDILKKAAAYFVRESR
jgi:transposase